MKPESMQFIYKAMNALASRKHDPETERCLSDAIEHQLLTLSAQVALQRRHASTMSLPALETYIADFPAA